VISVLLDSGSIILLMNQNTARRREIPTEARHSPLQITTFDGETAPPRGIFYTHLILLEISANGHRSMISCEIANAGRYDLIKPFEWWYNDHALNNIADASKWAFEETRCHAHIEDEAVPDMFERDETVAYDEEAQYVGRIEREEEGGVQLKPLPKPYWQYKELSKSKKTQGWRLEGLSIMPSTVKNGPSPHGVQFIQCQHTS